MVLVPGLVHAKEVCGLPSGDTLELESEAVYLVDWATGKVLFEDNADTPLYPASTTKIMTALLLLENAQLNEVIVVGQEIKRIGYDSSTARLKAGDRLTVADMVHALMLPSGNDAAYTTAVYVARRISGFERMEIGEAITVFVQLMNERAQELGTTQTNFTCPDGYHNPQHVTSAKDLAIITQAALQHEFLCQVVSTEEYTWQDRRWANTNRMLRQNFPEEYYPWTTGFKTGYTPQAGGCFVFSASGGGRDILGVTLKGPRGAIWKDARALLEYGFTSWQNHAVFVEGRKIFDVPVQGQRHGQPETLTILAGGTYSDLLHLAEISSLEVDFAWAQGINDGEQKDAGHMDNGRPVVLKAPIEAGQVLGQAVIKLQEEVLAEIDMVAAYTVTAYNWWALGSGIGVMFINVVLIFLILKTRSRRRRESSLY